MKDITKYKYQWQYTDAERDAEKHGKCYDCGLPYPEGNDCVIPDHVWERINPTYHEGAGILCANCIMARLDYLKIYGVQATLW